MTTPPGSPGAAVSLFDPSLPFKGVVVCCTSIPPEQRSDIAAKTSELGGIHKYDLTPDVTHLIVGEYDTPKYRHVAKERPDIRPMAAGWVEAVRDLWVRDADMNFAALEEEWQLRPLETSGGNLTAPGNEAERAKLLCCITGFEDPDQRQKIVDSILANGGAYSGDLTRRVTHLIAARPEGRKYAAAKSWGVQTVSIEWLRDSIERGMILDEKYYDPVLPADERGKGAWTRREVKRVSLGKRLRESATSAQGDGKRKLRKTASMKLNSQCENLWGDILGKPPSADAPVGSATESPRPHDAQPPADTTAAQPSRESTNTQHHKLTSFGTAESVPVFASCCFYVHGFPKKKAEILVNTVAYMGGFICHTLDEVTSSSGAQLAHRFIVVPQDSKPETHPSIPDNVQIITEFFVEKCLHKKQLFNPADHVIGQPFPVFPIEGFENLTICTAGFTGVDLNQVDKAIRQIGATYEERFTAQCSVLICTALSSVRKQKLDLALAWKVPVISAEWLWTCIATGYKVPTKPYMFPSLKQRPRFEGTESNGAEVPARRDKQDKAPHAGSCGRQPSLSKDTDGNSEASASIVPQRASKNDGPGLGRDTQAQDSEKTRTFETARTHMSEVPGEFGPSVPLGEVSSNACQNRSPSPFKPARLPRKPRSRIPSEIANSESADEPPDLAMDIGTENDMAFLGDWPHERREDETSATEDQAVKLAAERQALSAKLTTLLEGVASNNGTVAEPLPNSRANAEGQAPTALAAAAAAAAPSRPARRRREILGRAVSNVSATSSCSVESGSAPGANGARGEAQGNDIATGAASDPSKALPTTGSFSRAANKNSDYDEDGGSAAGLPGASGDGGQEDDAPPATQLQFEDPNAARYKSQLLNKMLGATAAKNPRVRSAETHTRPTEEKLTLANLGGYETERAGVSTRSRRR
ncbi:hypothetical protein VTK73DRAFT_7759 [Phialemonium thermophilum]|uniref:BRCT domain-containing protein n=1 Tax=Phialemonium thermophilum TaxID=223376 RepID=A0ABR3XRF9_9PEZI